MRGLVVRVTYFLLGVATVGYVGWVVPKYLLPESQVPIPDMSPEDKARLREISARHDRVRQLEQARIARMIRIEKTRVASELEEMKARMEEMEARMSVRYPGRVEPIAMREVEDPDLPESAVVPRGVCGWLRR